jgi:hypothetical protein
LQGSTTSNPSLKRQMMQTKQSPIQQQKRQNYNILDTMSKEEVKVLSPPPSKANPSKNLHNYEQIKPQIQSSQNK